MSNEQSKCESPRSWLFVPGTRLDQVAKAMRSGADAIIVDLEDAVLPQHKSDARRAVANVPDSNASIYVRVNSTGTHEFSLDVAAVMQSGVIAGIVLPKVECSEDLDALSSLMMTPLPVVALIETAKGITNLFEVTRHPAVSRVAFGGVDFSLDVGCASDSTTARVARAEMVLACRSAGLPAPIDGVTVSMEHVIVEIEAQDARRMGFGGKLCIHPRQIDCTNRAFLPTDEEIKWARKVTEQAANIEEGALLVDGQMIDRPVLERAKRILVEAR
jgi:citrate lyase subunit beta / citryl-CoA lyase